MSDELSARKRKMLVFLNQGNKPLDPIRIMKGLFLFEMKAPEAWRPVSARYDFTPYNYGPFSPEVYRDLEQLSDEGFVLIERHPVQSWNYYSLTEVGKLSAQESVAHVGSSAAEYLRTLHDFVARVSFRQLLDAVYREFPDYAVNSVFKK